MPKAEHNYMGHPWRANMPLTAYQELRKELLFRALDTCDSLDAAVGAATRLERFIMSGEESAVAPALSDQREHHTEESGVPVDSPPETGSTGKRRHWLADDDASLRKLWKEDHAADEIAQMMQRTTASIYSRAHQLGLARRVTARTKPSPSGKLDAGSQQIKIKKDVQTKEPTLLGNHTSSIRANGGAADELVSIDTVVHFLRSRDYSVVKTRDGHYNLDEREMLTAQELFNRANRVREQLGRPVWADSMTFSD